MSTPLRVRRRGASRLPTRRIAPAVALALVTGLAAAFSASSASAQTSGELRRENARLREAVADREAEVRTLQARLAELLGEVSRMTARVAELEAAAAAAVGQPGAAPGERTEPDGRDGTEAGLPEPVVTVDESTPEASPRAVRRAAQRRWAAGPGTLERGDDARSPARTNYVRALTAWTREQNRTWDVSVDWLVRLTAPPALDGGVEVWRMQAHDPVSDAELGPPFEVRVRRSIARRLERRLPNDGASRPRLRLRGPVVMRFAVDPARPEPGPFNAPALLAPFVTFEFGIDARSIDLEPVPKPSPTPKVESAPAAPAGGTGVAGASGASGSAG